MLRLSASYKRSDKEGEPRPSRRKTGAKRASFLGALLGGSSKQQDEKAPSQLGSEEAQTEPAVFETAENRQSWGPRKTNGSRKDVQSLLRMSKGASSYDLKKLAEDAFEQGSFRREGSKVETTPARPLKISVEPGYFQLGDTSASPSSASGRMFASSSLGALPPGLRLTQSTRLPISPQTQDVDDVLGSSFSAAQVSLMSKRRAESDPTPIWGSTEFVDEDDDGQLADEDGEVTLGAKKRSFHKVRAPSFNSEEQGHWGGRRSLQLVNNDESSANVLGGSNAVHISAATLERLVEYVVKSSEFMEASQVSGFLLTYHSYVNSQGLLSALASRYDMSTVAGDQVARIRTLYVLQRWIEEHWYDFESDDILLMGVVHFASSRLKEYDDQGKKHDPCFSLLEKLTTVQALAKEKLKNKPMDVPVDDDDDDGKTVVGDAPMLGRRSAADDEDLGQEGREDARIPSHNFIAPRLLKHQSKLLIKLEKAPQLELPQNFAGIWLNKLEGKPLHVVLMSSAMNKVEIARQITLIEHDLYKRIPPTELIAQATKQLARPPDNVRTMISHFNHVSKLVASSICGVSELQGRAQLYRKWVKIGKECLKLNNYNAVFEIIAGIHSVAVYRLHKTRNAQGSKTRQIQSYLEEVTSRKGNYATYRALLAQKTVPIQPSVPFIGATLTDLSFLDFGHNNVVENGEGDTLINFAKHRRVAKVMNIIKKFQDHPYLLNVCPEVSGFLKEELSKAAQVSDKELYNKSIQLEPPQNQVGQDFFGSATDDIAEKKQPHRKESSKPVGGLAKKEVQ